MNAEQVVVMRSQRYDMGRVETAVPIDLWYCFKCATVYARKEAADACCIENEQVCSPFSG